MPVATRLVGPRITLEAFCAAVAVEVHPVVAADREHLARYMPFAVEPQSLDETMDLFAEIAGKFASNDYAFVIRDPSGTVAGACGLHDTVGKPGRAAGYWLRRSAIGKGYATEAASLLLHLAFRQERVDRVEFHVEPSNRASAAITTRLGCIHEATLRRRLPWPGEQPRDIEVHTMFADGFSSSPAAALALQAFDAAGRPLEWADAS